MRSALRLSADQSLPKTRPMTVHGVHLACDHVILVGREYAPITPILLVTRAMTVRTSFRRWLRLGWGLASFASVCACGDTNVRVDAVKVRLVAHDTSWQASYVFQAARGASELPTGREVHVPVGSE